MRVIEVSMERRRNEKAGGGGGEREIPADPTASSGTIPTLENPRQDRPGRRPHAPTNNKLPSPGAKLSSRTGKILDFTLGQDSFQTVYTEVTFANGSEFVRHTLDDSALITDLQGNKKRILYCQMIYNDSSRPSVRHMSVNHVTSSQSEEFPNAQSHHRGTTLDPRSDLRSTRKTLAPFEFRAGLEIEMKFISKLRNWRFEISVRDQQPSSKNIETEIKLDPGSELRSFDLGSGWILVQPGTRRLACELVLAARRKKGVVGIYLHPCPPLHYPTVSPQHMRMFRGLVTAPAVAPFEVAASRCLQTSLHFLTLRAEEYTTCRQVDLKRGFQKCSLYRERPIHARTSRERWSCGGVAVRLLASHQGEPGSISGGVAPFFRVQGSCGTIPWVGGFSRVSSVYTALCIPTLLHTHLASPASALKTSKTQAAKISSLVHSRDRCCQLNGISTIFHGYQIYSMRYKLELRPISVAIGCNRAYLRPYAANARSFGLTFVSGKRGWARRVAHVKGPWYLKAIHSSKLAPSTLHNTSPAVEVDSEPVGCIFLADSVDAMGVAVVQVGFHLGFCNCHDQRMALMEKVLKFCKAGD
ncbi:hypothetical protein PR048_033520 [Dryococelus australis]|uniref:Uncharacterized protein n=1 Tax=Dryococelus australis TaxID=614101 RepID=A0ABQ9G4P5_9NEOP|nr:hypothetical protein PR048_033520 [Dryococelus australis]